MADIIIEPSLLPKEEKLTGPCLFCLTPYETGILKRYFPAGQSTPEFLFNSYLYRIDHSYGTFYWAGPAIGAPMAVMSMEKLIARGITKFIAVGWCGSLTDKVRATELVLPSRGLSEEGVSGHYLGGPISRLPGSFRGKVADQLAGEGFTVHHEPVWTTDALYRESWSRAKRYSAQGLVAVDMEFTALARLAAFRGVELAVVLIVSDEIREGYNKTSFKGKGFKKTSKSLMEALINGLRNEDF